MLCSKTLVGKKEKEILSNRENVSTMKHESILHSVQCHVQRFIKAYWLHTNVNLENFLKLYIASDLRNE